MADKSKIDELVNSSKEIGEITTRGGGTWDIDGLAEALKQMFGKKPGMRELRLDKVMTFHSTGDIKHAAHNAKEKIEAAAKLNGWTVKKIGSRTKPDGTKVIQFEVEFPTSGSK